MTAVLTGCCKSVIVAPTRPALELLSRTVSTVKPPETGTRVRVPTYTSPGVAARGGVTQVVSQVVPPSVATSTLICWLCGFSADCPPEKS
ncbi:hypothetical protein OG894_41300 [Streptomyces sp. NBC_01724]|uniref:hypothetical protein n=1 Tax=unclassified Streptomyces TaxID=2593676 RepID=UPI002E339B6E|nr:hypothetical protein [Streptomyces sp. NBC_01724]WTE49320.1 hypothetical protein OG987_00495 [Streptomyces sp. NBC_01620]